MTSSHRRYRLPCFDPAKTSYHHENAASEQSDPGRRPRPDENCFRSPDFSDQGGGDIGPTQDLLEPSAFFARAMPGVDVLLEHSISARFAYWRQEPRTEPRGCRNPTVLLVSNHLEQLGCPDAPLRRIMPTRPYAHGSRLTASFADEREAVGCDPASSLIVAAEFRRTNASTAASQPRRSRQRPLHRSCCASHRPSHSRRHQSYRVAERLKLTAPMMSLGQASMPTTLDGKVEKNSKTLARLTRFDRNRAFNVHAVNLDTDFAISRPIAITSPIDGSPESGDCFNAAPLWHSDAEEWAPSTASTECS